MYIIAWLFFHQVSAYCLIFFFFFFLENITAFPRIETSPFKFTIYFVHLWHLCWTALATLSFSHQLSLCQQSRLLRSTTVKRTVTFLLNTVYKTSTRTPIKRNIRRPKCFSLLRKGVIVAFVWQCFLHLHRIASHCRNVSTVRVVPTSHRQKRNPFANGFLIILYTHRVDTKKSLGEQLRCDDFLSCSCFPLKTNPM